MEREEGVMSRTFTQAVAQHFTDRPGQWIDGNELSLVGGCYAWRSRVSDCRTQLGMVIENRERRVGKRVVSEYRFIPAGAPVQDELFS